MDILWKFEEIHGNFINKKIQRKTECTCTILFVVTIWGTNVPAIDIDCDKKWQVKKVMLTDWSPMWTLANAYKEMS